MGAQPIGYGVNISDAVTAITTLRGKASAAADPGNNTAEESFMTDGLQTIVPSGPFNIAFSRTAAEVLAIV